MALALLVGAGLFGKSLWRLVTEPRGFAVEHALVASVKLPKQAYGVLAQAVLQRTHELGIRLALGAQDKDLLWLVVRQGMTPVVLGLLGGLVAAYWLTRLLTGLLYGVGTHDLATFSAVPLLLSAAALLACYLPARRATRLDPLRALRHE